MKNKFYITTAIPYINSRPHVGHALEYVVADAIHRYHELIEDETRIVSGADENALKNVQAAEKAGVVIQKFLDKNSQIFKDFYKLLEVDLNEFRRGTDKEKHWPGVEKIWKLVEKNGDLYKKKYKGLYCVGCEEFKTEKDLVDGKCPDHDKAPLEVEEENYFFKLSKYQDKLLKLIESGKYAIYPEKRKNEVISFIKSGLEDFSVSRSEGRARGVGVPVPGDPSQKIYVWFDALTIYMTGTGFGYDEKLWKKWWPADLHIVGKDIIRFHAVYWPAMLLSAGLPLPKSLLVHGFITSDGRKMSKTIGNVIDPYEIIKKYGVEALRYYLLAKIPTQDDGDFTVKSFEQVYQADLANGLGNLIARVAKLCESSDLSFPKESTKLEKHIVRQVERFELNRALETIWQKVNTTDEYISVKTPWNKKGKELESILKVCVTEVRQIAFNLQLFLPETAEKIEKQFKGPKIKSGEILFPRLR